ncbi:NUDIX domain-containing protein [Nocardioides caldifontis]|uniref:NUDIX domain-containing protein n=1 Tax=Nocardioides caldifontis TaxID=2588938 RepID=UPI0011E05E3E|nr:NUDIX domain-containing protein [Nocardioides caldifontis]
MDRFQVVPAAYLLLLRGEGADLELLLQLRGPATTFMAGHWASAAAGHVELGESVQVAAAREAVEELGIAVAPDDVEPLCTMQRTLPGVNDPVEQRVDFFLTTRRWQGEPAVQEPRKAVGLGWFRPSAPPEPMVPHEGYLLGLLADSLRTGRPLPPILTYGF